MAMVRRRRPPGRRAATSPCRAQAVPAQANHCPANGPLSLQLHVAVAAALLAQLTALLLIPTCCLADTVLGLAVLNPFCRPSGALKRVLSCCRRRGARRLTLNSRPLGRQPQAGQCLLRDNHLHLAPNIANPLPPLPVSAVVVRAAGSAGPMDVAGIHDRVASALAPLCLLVRGPLRYPIVATCSVSTPSDPRQQQCDPVLGRMLLVLAPGAYASPPFSPTVLTVVKRTHSFVSSPATWAPARTKAIHIVSDAAVMCVFGCLFFCAAGDGARHLTSGIEVPNECTGGCGGG